MNFLPIGKSQNRHRLRSRFGMATAISAILLAAGVSIAAATPAEDAIRAAFVAWTQNFNTGQADAACGLFSKDLRYDYRGLPERGYAEICDVLHRSLADPKRHYSYALDLKEVIVSGDMAVARVIWTLTIAPSDGSASSKVVEYSMDIFKRQPDGGWTMVRFLAYDAPQ